MNSWYYIYLCIGFQFCCTYGARKNHPYKDMSPYPTNFFTETYKNVINNRPTIGIVAMKLDGLKMLKEAPQARNKDYFGASFVKLVESAGGRAVPILEDILQIDEDENFNLKHLLSKVNGIILPGGDGDLGESGYEKISREIVKYSREQAKKGILFPVLGICRGSQMMMTMEWDEDILTATDSSNISLPLYFQKGYRKSKLLGHAPKGLIKVLGENPITFHAHQNSVLLNTYYRYKVLQQKFRVLATSYDRNGVEFISMYEGKTAPLYGLQWHPEKALFIYNPNLAVDHSIFGVTAAQYIANVFMGDARQNPNRFPERKEEENSLIFKYTPVYVGNITETPYEQIYIFDFVNPFVGGNKIERVDLDNIEEDDLDV